LLHSHYSKKKKIITTNINYSFNENIFSTVFCKASRRENTTS